MTTLATKNNTLTVAGMGQQVAHILAAFQGAVNHVSKGEAGMGTAEVVITDIQDGVGDDGQPEGKVITFHFAGSVPSYQQGILAEVALELVNGRGDIPGVSGAFLWPLDVEDGPRQWELNV